MATKEDNELKLKNIRHNGKFYTINEIIGNLAQEKKTKTDREKDNRHNFSEKYTLKSNEYVISEVDLALQPGRLHTPTSAEEMAKCAENYCLFQEFHENDRNSVRIVKNNLNEDKIIWTNNSVIPLYPNYFGKWNKNPVKYPPPIHPAVAITCRDFYPIHQVPPVPPQQQQLTMYGTYYYHQSCSSASSKSSSKKTAGYSLASPATNSSSTTSSTQATAKSDIDLTSITSRQTSLSIDSEASDFVMDEKNF